MRIRHATREVCIVNDVTETQLHMEHERGARMSHRTKTSEPGETSACRGQRLTQRCVIAQFSPGSPRNFISPAAIDPTGAAYYKDMKFRETAMQARLREK